MYARHPSLIGFGRSAGTGRTFRGVDAVVACSTPGPSTLDAKWIRTMANDPIVDEIHAIREEIARRHNYDLEAIAELEALGVKLDLAPAQVAQCIDEVGIGFLFAPRLHPAMKNVGPTRVELGTRFR